MKKVENMLNKYYKNDNSNEVSKYFIQIYNFIAMYKAKKNKKRKI